MSDFFKSALGYFNPGQNGGIGGPADDDFVGQIVEVGTVKLHVKRMIAEGGFAYVYVVQDVQTHTEYALKRLMGSDKQACNNIIREINLHKQLSGHPNIVRYVAASFIDRTNGGAQGNAEYLLVSELCKGGSLADCLTTADIEPETVLRLAYQATQALRHMHGQSVPVTHRDIKIENFLLGADGLLKLCDFGSATTDTFQPTASWTAAQRDTLEDQLASITTPMYRAPEHLDLWSNHAIGPKADVWALGCVIYCLCYRRHPFEDSAKLRIVNANYTLPADGRYACFQDIIRGCFHVDPVRRFDVATVLDRLAAIAETKGWQLKGELRLSGKPIATPPMECGTPATASSPTHSSAHSSEASSASRAGPAAQQQHQQHPQRPPPPSSAATFHVPAPSPLPTRPAPMPQRAAQQQQPMHAPENQYPHPPNAAAAGGSLFSSLRGGAGSFLRNLKDTSSKVMQTVQQTMARTDLDISAITSRVLVMPVPSEGLESTYKVNNIDDVRVWLESRYAPAKLSVYNLGARTAARLPPPVRTVDAGSMYGAGGAAQHAVPTLAGMYSMAEDMFGYLCADAAGTLCVQSADQGRAQAATMVCALFIYAGLVQEPEDAMQIFAVRRMPPNLRPSEVRYLYYLGDLVRSVPHWPHQKPLALASITCSPVPRMTKARDGCRMYAEVLCGDRVVLTTELEYEHMRLYQAHEGSVTIDLNNVMVCGDFVVTLYHTRNALKGMGRPQAIRVCQFQMHSGFVAEQETLIRLERSELDDVPDVEHVPNGFVVSVPIAVGGQDRPMAAPWKPFKQQPDAQVLFGTLLEYEENVDNFVTKLPPKKATPPTRPTAPTVQRPVDVPQQHHHAQPPARPSPPQPSRPPPMQQRAQPTDGAILDLSSSPEPSAVPTSVQPQQQPFVKEPSFDLLGEFQSGPSQPTQSVPDLLSNTRTNSTGLDDLFGTLPPPQHSTSAASDLNHHFADFATTPIAPLASSASHSTLFESLDPTFNAANKPLTPMSTTAQSSAAATASAANVQASNSAPKDPFADLGNLGAGLGSGWLPTMSSSTNGNNAQRQPPMMTSPMATQFSSPTHVPQQPSPRPPSTPNHQPSGADYSRSHFDNNGTKAAAGKTGAAPGVAPTAATTACGTANAGFGGDIFGDILGQQGYNFASKSTFSSPRSINEMRKEELVRDMDPDKLKIMEWTEGKKNNIRALLCSMHTILWTDAKWQKCEMHTLVSSADVKKAYRKACLAVHPDKQMGTDNEVMSKMIFIELNNAWTDFENDATQQSVFS